jgi:predicted permease
MKLLRKFRALFHKEKLDAEMAEEMRAHLDMQTEVNTTRGMSPEEARYAARREFGGLEQIKEQARDQRGWVWIEQLQQDLRFAFRQLRRNPGFALVAILTLAVGTGANTAIFSLVNSLVLKPLAYEEPGQLVQVWESPRGTGRNPISPGVFLDWQSQATTFESLAAYRSIDLNLTGAGEPERISGLRVTADGLRVLRARPLLGRIFAANEDQAGNERVVVLTYELWQRRFGGDPALIGRTIQLNDAPYTVIGILPAGFLPRATQEFVVPQVFPPAWREIRASHFLNVMGRVKSGVSLEQAGTELAAISARAATQYFPKWKKDWTATVVPMHEQLSGDLKPALLILLAAVVVVLLVACANVANLLLAKASARRPEIAVRAALGASRGRVIRQLLAESVLLSFLGAVLGLAIAVWSVAGLRHLVGAMNFARAHEIAIDGRVLGATLLVALVTGIVFGLAPALQASRFSLTDALKDASRGLSAGGGRVRQVLIVGEVALALVLLVGAGLLLNSFHRLISMPPGFAPEQALTMQLSLPDKKYPGNAQRLAFFTQMIARIEALPGVDSASVSSTVPLASGFPDNFFRVDGRKDHPDPGYAADYDYGTSHVFRALGIPLRLGRTFTDADATVRVAIVNEEFVRRVFPGENPLGRRISMGTETQTWEIVGVVGDVRGRGLAQSVRAMVYRPQSPTEASSNSHLVVRAAGSPRHLAESVRQAILTVDSSQPVARVRTLEEVVSGSVADRRLTLGLLAGFAGTALALAAIGLYGVIAYSVAQRTREIGIRVALGASRRDVFGLVLGEGMRLVLLGLLIGLGAAFGLTRLLEKMLYQVKPTDPQTFAVVSLVLLAAALFASWLPARRAARIEPMAALRTE